MSTPSSLDLPDGVRHTTIPTSRGTFAALEAVPASGVCEREAALLVPGYTGSKEDFLAILDLLADRSRRVTAIDMRGQFETPGVADPSGYAPAELAADLLAIMRATGARHLVGHSYGGLIGREAVLAEAAAAAGLTGTGLAGAGLAGTGLAGAQGQAGTGLAGAQGQADVASLTLMSSGPGALTGPRADELAQMLAALGVTEQQMPDAAALREGIAGVWQAYLEPQAIAAGVPAPVVAFLGQRMLANDPVGLVQMARHMLIAPDRTAELMRLASQLPIFVIYGENDNAWSPAAQEDMARRLGARRHCIPAAVHSPAVEAPATTASALTQFWDATEQAALTHAVATGHV